MNNIITGENTYITTVGKGLKKHSVEGRFRQVRVVLLAEDKDKSGN